MRQYVRLFSALIMMMASAVPTYADDPAKVSDSLRTISHFGSVSTKKAVNANTVTLLTGTIGGTYVQFGADCPSSDDLRLVRRFVKGGSGSSGLEFKRPATDAASVGWRWLHA